ncbi:MULTISPECIES: hypothetical protein [unclassified Pseudoalteromonas]|uniref:hypothetical protein n=1 Tax=unclassified Pseudoalteromonas TaxID=194690 RepID=UPI002097AC40|nr:hypothetical protein [Pseudoalteromonas sp. XMcav2-N]MCO7189549.1 hypothetical protein [Pseudoalteromonas sp. XMcav2-N]
MSNLYDQAVNGAEQQATQAVAQADADTAAQSTGYATTTPFEAEDVARNAVVAADQSMYQQAFNSPSNTTPDLAEQIATEAVEATE